MTPEDIAAFQLSVRIGELYPNTKGILTLVFKDGREETVRFLRMSINAELARLEATLRVFHENPKDAITYDIHDIVEVR